MKNISTVAICDIQIGERHRQDFGDIDSLAQTISDDGLLQPIGITPDNRLVFGYRRLTACRDSLGWTEIPAVVIDIDNLAHGEFVENTFRKDLTPSEMVAVIDAMRTFSRGGDRRSKDFHTNGKSVTKKDACENAGWKTDMYDDAKKVVESGVPELRQAMDEGKISISHAAKIAAFPSDDQQESVRRGRLTVKRDPHDFYPTPRNVTEALLQCEQFSSEVWEPACGDGAMSEVLKDAGYSVESSDLIDRNYGEVEDFLSSVRRTVSIITNPPYGKSEEFVRKALACTTDKVAMFLPLTFLESRKRESLLASSCLKTVYVFVDRVSLYKGGADNRGGGRAAYAWFVWEHGYNGQPTIGWVRSNRNREVLKPIDAKSEDGTAPIDFRADGSDAA